MSPRTLEREFTDFEQSAIAAADRKFADVHGDVKDWSPLEEIAYVRLIERVHNVFHPEAARLRAGLLAEQRHQVLDLDTDSVWPVPAVLAVAR